MPASVVKKNKSAIKRTRQTEKKTLRNRSIKSEMKTLIKNIETAVSNKDAAGARTTLKKAIKAIDKASQKGVIHKSTASRKVSRLSKLVNSGLPSEAA
ncbi:30S ribosomal protein S20 [bacterium BMS3Abin09]|nr:30S ribosomal protein S20 [bacterium BMS3Abin09]GBE41027.1 30S ribosomal protein S20 [bacterium BMS3Bbin09]HDH34634.1 30S ribosomal protein S20 [Nitrospirota bacterium]